MSTKLRYLRFPKSEQILLTKRLSLLLDAGMPLLPALAMMREQAVSRSAKCILESLMETTSAGQPLSRGLAGFEKQFGTLSIHLVQVGEESGTLAAHLLRLSDALKREQTLRRKVVGALMYPGLILLATLGITALLTLYIFPKIVPIFKGFHAALPLPTRVLIALSSFIGAYWLALLGLCIVSIAGLYLLLRLPHIRLLADRAALRVPVVGPLLQQYAIAHFCRSLSTLLRSEIGVVRALESTAAGCTNLAYQGACRSVARRAASGEKLAAALALEPRLFPPLLTQMLSVAESTGTLSESLIYCAVFYEEELEERSRGIALLIEPMLMICMGLVVGFVAIAILSPIYGITQNLNPYH